MTVVVDAEENSRATRSGHGLDRRPATPCLGKNTNGASAPHAGEVQQNGVQIAQLGIHD